MTRYEYDVLTFEDDGPTAFPKRSQIALQWVVDQATEARQTVDWGTLKVVGPRDVPEDATGWRITVDSTEGHEFRMVVNVDEAAKTF